MQALRIIRHKYEILCFKTPINATYVSYNLQSAYEQRTSYSGFNSFLKWFKKDEQGRSIRNTSNSKSNKQQHSNHFNSIDEIRNISSSQVIPNQNSLSSSSSCDSIISTATTSFAFIPPNQYRPNGNASRVSRMILQFSLLMLRLIL